MENHFTTKLADRRLNLTTAEGETTPIHVQIGHPYWTEKNISASCPVKIEGLHEKLVDISGADHMQALQLALQFVEQLLANEISNGCQITWPDGEAYQRTDTA